MIFIKKIEREKNKILCSVKVPPHLRLVGTRYLPRIEPSSGPNTGAQYNSDLCNHGNATHVKWNCDEPSCAAAGSECLA
jgi:hypothetical protein